MKKFLCTLLGLTLLTGLFVPLFAFAEEEASGSWTKLLNPTRDYLILVNEDNPYEFDGAYDTALQSDLDIKVDSFFGEDAFLETATRVAFEKLQFALEQKGIRIGLFGSGASYRTYDQQKGVYDYYSELPGWGYTTDEEGNRIILNSVAEPGKSEHHTGLLLNIVYRMKDGDDEIWATETAERENADPEFFDTLHETLWEYGFIVRYPAGKEEITGVYGQVQEIRFVGSSEVAYEIYSRGLCLEEYLAEKGD